MNHEEALKFIEQKVQSSDLLLFMKGTPDFPMCGFSGRVVEIMKHFNQKFDSVNVLDDEGVRQAIKEYSSWPTIPQVYVKGEFIGGCDIISEMAQNGQFESLLKAKLS